MKLGQLIDVVMGTIFRKKFGGLSPEERPFLIDQPAAINQKSITMSV